MPLLLDALYTGPMEGLTPPKVGPIQAPALPMRDLLTPERFEAELVRFRAGYGYQSEQGDRRALVSLWSKWHFGALLAPYLAANLLLERDLPMGLDEMGVWLTAEGRTERLQLAHAGRPLTSLDGFTRFSTLIDDHLTPLIGRLAALSGASAKVFWSNAGNTLEYFLNAVEAHPMATPGIAEEGHRLLASRTTANGRRNPLYQPVRYFQPECQGEADASATQRVRRLCCLRYLLPELGYCGNCPLSNRATG
ncbi:siderophore-iron reductase FhuF [Halomonas sp. I5-271120]|uniref:siderophore-iron reductase FhuF n=1 Tax=Halomonas sp. I5-271120 TaxID=3061632 RepID=UPI002715202D|nr:siderophore-iron reductase FhuF [Halomonas sp. I5-271120]